MQRAVEQQRERRSKPGAGRGEQQPERVGIDARLEHRAELGQPARSASGDRPAQARGHQRGEQRAAAVQPRRLERRAARKAGGECDLVAVARAQLEPRAVVERDRGAAFADPSPCSSGCASAVPAAKAA